MSMTVPWFNCNEWKYVKDLIYGDVSNQESQKLALSILQLWKDRTPKLPIGIEGTLIILDVLLQNPEVITPSNYRLLCGSALMRFLNLCCARNDKQGTFYKTAKQNGIPDWIINIRHDFAHDAVIPSQFMLNLSLEFALNWLKTAYWEQQALTIKDVRVNNKSEKWIEQAIELYCRINLIHFQKKEVITDIKSIAFEDILLNKKIEEYKTINLKPDMEITNVVHVLLKTASKYVTKANKKKISRVIATTIIATDTLFKTKLIKKKNGSKEIPQKFLGLWKNLLQLLYTQDVLLSLLINLLKITNNAEAEDQIREMTSLWLQFLCKKLLVTKLQLQYNTDIIEHDQIDLKDELQGIHGFSGNENNEIFENIISLQMMAICDANVHTLQFLKYWLLLCDCSTAYINNIEYVVNAYVFPRDEIDNNYEPCTIDEANKILENFGCADLVIKEEIIMNIDEDIPLKREIENRECGIPKKKFRRVTDNSIFEGCPLGVLAYQKRDINPWLEYISHGN